MAICCCFHRTPQSRLCSILFSLTIVVALHAFAFVVKAPRELRRCNNVGCGSWNQISLAVIVFCFVAELDKGTLWIIVVCYGYGSALPLLSF